MAPGLLLSAEPTSLAWSEVLHGDAIALVRPYLIAHERRVRRQRRRVLWLAVHGFDLGSRVIHGVEVGR
ncbi:hypothetical protein [Streptomyces katsurahamanus]|uniref:hypothetical protein n=1 Tax=Streptomyces katsurahamanus TaxID=2577098 RepID=UPI002B1EFD5D|nr:hypothetical protein [Streptomyces katsurahamanus]